MYNFNKILYVALACVALVAVGTSASNYVLFQQYSDHQCASGNVIYGAYTRVGLCDSKAILSCNGTKVVLADYEAADCSGTPINTSTFNQNECQTGVTFQCVDNVAVPAGNLATSTFTEAACGGSAATTKYFKSNWCFGGSLISCNATAETVQYFNNTDCSGLAEDPILF
ncbi:hypothetical protein SAMD00019534_079760 [Acytostelium subglobosum LB1]|uniref:hypothetical protein n=1 Tax=Acytostelium subglobosum LB1 TaxID=1410327 RepID=UPI000644824A|nr:hypothetical protein SAMD00019534_079760 [Acytostelium subglobosum LB1]GAM24801.1 hypothetical protein SAMD00019534_079760 [Acytostelium subglobosum LB1]|eukprot:XP_012752470.1 hypothetical protein SAMD00019534_079760 [Acytostelium subglobosum LB1]